MLEPVEEQPEPGVHGPREAKVGAVRGAGLGVIAEDEVPGVSVRPEERHPRDVEQSPRGVGSDLRRLGGVYSRSKAVDCGQRRRRRGGGGAPPVEGTDSAARGALPVAVLVVVRGSVSPPEDETLKPKGRTLEVVARGPDDLPQGVELVRGVHVRPRVPIGAPRAVPRVREAPHPLPGVEHEGVPRPEALDHAVEPRRHVLEAAVLVGDEGRHLVDDLELEGGHRHSSKGVLCAITLTHRPLHGVLVLEVLEVRPQEARQRLEHDLVEGVPHEEDAPPPESLCNV